MPDRSSSLTLETPQQLKAFSHPTRRRILSLLASRPASTKELAEALGIPRGTAGHHIQTLADAGLVEVVRTRKVRAITEKFYARTAVTFLLKDAAGEKGHFLREALGEMRAPGDGEAAMTTLRHARLDADRAEEWYRRLVALSEEFAAEPIDGATTYGLVVGLYPTDLPSLPKEEEA